MRKSHWTPSIIPDDNNQTVYLVAEDFGKLGSAWRETDFCATDRETLIQDLLDGQYINPIRVVAFNTAEGWAQDVSKDVAFEIQSRCDIDGRDVPETLQDFVDIYAASGRQLALRLMT